jgi:hypothetical protein
MILNKEDIIRMKFSILKATIVPIAVTDRKVLNEIQQLSMIEDYDQAYKVLEEHIRTLVRYEKIIIKRHPQIIRNVLSKSEVQIGFDIRSINDLNKLKLINSKLIDKIRMHYDIRV